MSLSQRVRPYVALFRARFLALLQYRSAAAAGIATQLLFGLVYVMVYQAFYGSGLAEPPVPLHQIITMTWIGQAMLGMLPWNGDSEVISALRQGDIAYELARPLSLYDHWYVRAMAMRAAPTLLRCVPQFLVSMFLLPSEWRMTPPPVAGWMSWFACVCGALLLAAAISNIISISFLWTLAGDGILRLIGPLVNILSGMQVSLLIYPDWLREILQLLPFAGLHEYPARIFAGVLPASAALWVLPFQLGWAAAIMMLGRALMKRGLKRLIVQGG